MDSQVSIDAQLCDDCGRCVPVCPNHALALISELETVIAPTVVARAIDRPATDLIPVKTIHPGPWRSAVRPAFGAFLSWAGHELVPRLVPLALDALEAVLDRQLAQRTKGVGTRSSAPNLAGGGRRRRHRHRFGQTQE